MSQWYKKGEAVSNFPFRLLDANGVAVTTGTTTGSMTIDGVKSATLANASHVGDGMWNISFTAAEMNGDSLYFLPSNAGAVTVGKQLCVYTEIDSNLIQINGVTLPVTNLANTFNGTGYTAPTAPAQQQQLDNLATGSGGISIYVDGATITTGTETNTYTDTFTPNGVYHIINQVGGVIDFEYTANVDDSGVTQNLILDFYAQGNNSTVTVECWDWVSSSFKLVRTLIGTSAATKQEITIKVPSNATGTGANDGDVRIRFSSSDAVTVGVDRLWVEYTVVADSGFIIHKGTAQAGTASSITLDNTASAVDKSYIHSRIIITEGTGAGQENIGTDYNGSNRLLTVREPWLVVPDSTSRYNITPGQVHTATQAPGYENGAVYIDTTSGVDGTNIGFNGTSSHPVKTMAIARTIADNSEVGSNRVVFDKGVDVATFDQDYVRFLFSGRNPVGIDLAGFDISFSSFDKLVVTGVATNNAGIAVYTTCGILDYTCGLSNFVDCGLVTRLTMNQSGASYTTQNLWVNKDNITDPDPELVFASNGVTGILFEGNNISGNYTIKGMKSLDRMELRGEGILTLDSTNNGGTIYYSGDIIIVDNSTTSPTLICGNICDIAVKIDDVPTVAEFEARTLPNADYFDPATDVVSNVTTVQTTVTNTDMRGTDNALLASAYVAPDNATIASIDTKIDNVPTVTIDATSVDSIFAGGNIDGYTLEQSQRLILSASAGKLSGAATSNVVIRDAADTKARITATVDQDGNRISTTLDAS